MSNRIGELLVREKLISLQQLRSAQGLPVPDIDENLIAALRAGLPPCAGVAIGFDRLLMINENTNDIRAVSSFTLN